MLENTSELAMATMSAGLVLGVGGYLVRSYYVANAAPMLAMLATAVILSTTDKIQDTVDAKDDQNEPSECAHGDLLCTVRQGAIIRP